jgi:hypothetical protein
LLVSPDNIRLLEAADRDDVGVADIWLTQAFQGGRISETLKLRLGCVGLVGTAQPYLWRDISKVNVVDYGMPCYLPVYERLLRRQEKTRAKLRARYAEQLATLDARGRAALETRWDREMPLFPRAVQNPDLVVEISQVWFRNVWVAWLERLGLKGITTHQTRATLATSLLNNGAPAALVRQLLGHFSPESLAHYANYNNDSMTRHLQQVWTAGPGMDKPGTILLRPTDVNTDDPTAAAARIDLTGWECSLSKQTALVERALRHAVALCVRQSRPFDNAIHHSDAGSQYTAIHFTETLMLGNFGPDVWASPTVPANDERSSGTTNGPSRR